MSWRYRRSVKLLPGLRMNVGSRGVTSFSLGGRGITINLSKRGTKSTYSLPGTGISYQTQTTRPHTVKPSVVISRPVAQVSGSQAPARAWKPYAMIGVAALIGYLALRPSDPIQQAAPSRQRAAVPPPEVSGSQLSVPLIISPAKAADAVGRQIGSAQKDQAMRREVTTKTGSNIRSSPSITAPIVKVLIAGTMLQIVGTDGGWDRVLDANGNQLGWIHESVVR